MTFKHLNTLVFKDWRYFLAFGLGSGLSPKAPGTCGTLAAIPLYLCVAQLPVWAYFMVMIMLFLLGTYVSEYVSKALGVDDYKGIVIDEVLGYFITMFLVPLSFGSICMGFLLFRFFDILKPFPIRYLDEKIKGGLGVMLDDVLAGLMAFILMLSLHFSYGVF